MSRIRVAIGAGGVLLGLFGAFRLVTEVPFADLAILALWLIGAVIVHDGILSPLLLAVGALLAKLPRRGRRYVQIGAIVAACVTVIALPLIYRENSQPRSKALLLQDYGGNLAVLLALIAIVSLGAYATRVARDHKQRTPAVPPDAD